MLQVSFAMLTGSARRTVAVTTAIFILALWSLVAYWVAAERQRTLDAATQQLEQLNAAVSGQIETLLKLAETSFSAANHWLVENPDADPYESPAFLGLIEELHRLTDGIVDLRAADHTGNSQWFGRERRERPLDVADRDYFLAQFDPKTQGLFIGHTFVGRQSALLGIPLSVRAEGRRLAVLFAVIKLDHLRALHEPQRMKPNGSITLIRQDGIILSRTPFAESALNQDISHHPDYVDHLARASSGVLTSGVGPVDSKSRLVGFAKLDHYPLFVICSALIDDVLLPWRKEAGRLGAVVGLVTLLTLVLAGRLLRAMQAREQASSPPSRPIAASPTSSKRRRTWSGKWMPTDASATRRSDARPCKASPRRT